MPNNLPLPTAIARLIINQCNDTDDLAAARIMVKEKFEPNLAFDIDAELDRIIDTDPH